MVFMFSDESLNLLDGTDFNHIREALTNCTIFKDADVEIVPTYKFFQIKKSLIPNSNRMLIQFIDISAKIFYDDVKAQEEYMNITTSSMSHEMRNPLNAIIAQCTVLALIILDLAAFILRIHHKLSADELVIANTIQDKISRSVEIMKTSSQLLLFNVEGILGVAQIRANKFQKNITEFDVGKCLDEIVGIQQFKADQLGIEV